MRQPEPLPSEQNKKLGFRVYIGLAMLYIGVAMLTIGLVLGIALLAYDVIHNGIGGWLMIIPLLIATFGGIVLMLIGARLAGFRFTRGGWGDVQE